MILEIIEHEKVLTKHMAFDTAARQRLWAGSCTSELQLKVNCRLKVNCKIKFGLACQLFAKSARFFSAIHF